MVDCTWLPNQTKSYSTNAPRKALEQHRHLQILLQSLFYNRLLQNYYYYRYTIFLNPSW